MYICWSLQLDLVSGQKLIFLIFLTLKTFTFRLFLAYQKALSVASSVKTAIWGDLCIYPGPHCVPICLPYYLDPGPMARYIFLSKARSKTLKFGFFALFGSI